MAVSIYAIIIAVIGLLLATRWITGLRSSKPSGDRAPLIPYWIPFVGDAFQLVFLPLRFLDSARAATFEKGYFALLALGQRVNVIYNLDIAQHILQSREDGEDAPFDSSSVPAAVRRNVFGLQKLPVDVMQRISEDMSKAYIQTLADSGRDGMLSQTLDEWSRQLPDLMTFNDSQVDQMPWERASKTSPLVGETINHETADADLFALVQSFVIHTVLPLLFGSTFAEVVPTLQEDLQIFSNAFFLLSLGLPRWAPIPRVTSAHIARRRMLKQLTSYHLAVARYLAGENEPSSSEWRDVSDVSDLVQAIHQTMAKNVPQRSSSGETAARAAASESLLLIWAVSCKLANIAYWTVFRVAVTDGLPERIRAGSSKVARATQPPPLMSMYPPPRLQFLSVSTPSTSPLLTSCVNETFRLYSRSWVIRRVRKDTSLSFKAGDTSSLLSLRSGEFAAVPIFLSLLGHRMSLKRDWLAERFEDEPQNRDTADSSELRPTDSGRCPGMGMSQSAVAAFVAGFFLLWNIEPTESGSPLPKPTEGLFIPRPRQDVRVRISKRALLIGNL